MNALILATLMLISTPDESRLVDIRKEVAARNERAKDRSAWVNAVRAEIAKVIPKPKPKAKAKPKPKLKVKANDHELNRLRAAVERNRQRILDDRARERRNVARRNRATFRHNRRVYHRSVQRFGRKMARTGVKFRSSVRVRK